MAAPGDPLHFRLLAPAGLTVRGYHDPRSLPVHPALQADFEARHPALLSRVLARPGGFDGHRACLLSWAVEDGRLLIRTGYRSYTQGLALKEALRAARAGNDQLLRAAVEQPDPLLSWGASLVCVVLLPGDRVLAGERSATMAVNPNVWSCGFTEVLEPSDVSPEGMQALAGRLVREELPSLAPLGRPFFAGLGMRPASGTWQLVSVLDLRHAGPAALSAVQALEPDKETSAWAAVSLADTDLAMLDHDLACELARVIAPVPAFANV